MSNCNFSVEDPSVIFRALDEAKEALSGDLLRTVKLLAQVEDEEGLPPNIAKALRAYGEFEKPLLDAIEALESDSQAFSRLVTEYEEISTENLI